MNRLVTFVRYTLAMIMIMYAYIKLIGFQFYVPDEIKSIAISEADGVTLTFSFFGYSTWFSVLLGLTELVPAVFLLFRKTAFLGAILLLPILFLIFLINLAYDFVLLMKLWTGLLLVLDGLILYYYRARIGVILSSVVAKADSPSNSRRERWINCLLILVELVLLYFFIGSLSSKHL